MTDTFTVVVKTNAPKTEILNQQRGVYTVAVHAPPRNNQANIEIIKFFSRYLKKPVMIVKGLKSKEKILKVL